MVAFNVGTKPAPEPLRLVQAYINTIDLENRTKDNIRSPELLKEWLVASKLLRNSETVSEPDHRLALDVREALRDLAGRNAGEPVPPSSVALLERVAGSAPLVLAFADDGQARLEVQVPGVHGALGKLLAIVHQAMAEGTWSRLLACGAESCRWAFYDHSKNRSGTWCSMRVCGNRVKARSYRQRHAHATTPNR